MIIKDLFTKKFHVLEHSPQGPVRNVVLGITAEVIIRRGGEYYTVPIKKNLTIKEEDYTTEDLENFYNYFLQDCHSINDNWKLVEDMEGLHGKVIGQTLFKF